MGQKWLKQMHTWEKSKVKSSAKKRNKNVGKNSENSENSVNTENKFKWKFRKNEPPKKQSSKRKLKKPEKIKQVMLCLTMIKALAVKVKRLISSESIKIRSLVKHGAIN